VAESLLSLSRRSRPRHDLPATSACPVGLWRRRSAWSDGASRFAPGARAGCWTVPPQRRQAGSPGGGERPWHLSIVLVETGPILFAVLDADRWERVPCFTPVLGRGDDVAVFNAATAEIGRLLRRFERAERVDRRGRTFAPAGGRAWAYLRWRRSFLAWGSDSRPGPTGVMDGGVVVIGGRA